MAEPIERYVIETPVGYISLAEEDGALTELLFVQEPTEVPAQISPLLLEAQKQLEEYFRGDRKEFTLPLRPKGTEFRQKVWRALLEIPYGETRSYKEIAESVGNSRATRAVGGANHNNPISIIIPCHRVVGADGKLTGYGGGLKNKEFLLALEEAGHKD